MHMPVKHEGEELLYTCNWIFDGEDDNTISLWKLPNDNLVLKQGIEQVVLSWDELQELSDFYCEEMVNIEKKLACIKLINYG